MHKHEKLEALMSSENMPSLHSCKSSTQRLLTRIGPNGLQGLNLICVRDISIFKTPDSTTARQTKRPRKGPRESYSGAPGGRANPTRKLRPLSAPTGPRAQRRVGVRAAMPCRANKSVDSAKEAKAAPLVAQWLRRRTSETQVPRSNPSHIPYPISHIPAGP